MKRTIVFLAMALFGMAQQQSSSKPNAFTDKLGAKLALAQRDYVLANAQRDAALTALQSILKEAESACIADGKVLDGQKAECADKHAEPEVKKE